ncbi:MAG: polysaccharide biosynthesis protein [Clostridia bacterium]|nr:polysaccharide biosynthesis protein [Clostridia bacterium]
MGYTKKKRIKKEGFMQSVLVLMISQLVIKLLGLVYKIYLTNKEGFGDTGNAIYSSGYQIYALLLTISSIGVPNAISKLVSEKVAIGDSKGAHRIFKIALLTFGIIGFIATMILFIGAGYISSVILQIPEAEMTLVSLSPAIFFVTIASVLRGYFNGREKISITAKSQTLEQVFKTLLTVIVVEIVGLATNLNTTLMSAGANLATTLSVLLSFGYLTLYYKIYKRNIAIEIKNSVNYKRESLKKVVKKILFVSTPITLSAIMSTLNKNIDSITVVRGLKKFLTEAQAKTEYGILSGKVDTLITLPLSFNIAFATALVPSISASIARGDKESASKRISFSILVSILIGLPCTLGMMIFSQQILELLFPKATNGSILLQMSAITIIFSVLAQTINGALQGLGKIMTPAITSTIGLITKLIINIWLIQIPEIGVYGAVIGSIINNIVAFALSYIVLAKTIKLDMKFTKCVIKPLVATLIMGICSYYIYLLIKGIISVRIATIIAIIVAIIIYTLSLLALKVLDKEEMNMIPYGTKIVKILEIVGIYGKGKHCK